MEPRSSQALKSNLVRNEAERRAVQRAFEGLGAALGMTGPELWDLVSQANQAHRNDNRIDAGQQLADTLGMNILHLRDLAASHGFAFTHGEMGVSDAALGRSPASVMASERDQALLAARQMRARLEAIANDVGLPAEFLSLADRALSDLAAAEARCMGQQPTFLSINELAAVLTGVEKLVVSLAREVAAVRDRVNAPEAAQERARTALAAMQSDLFEKKVLDPYLHFDSAKEEDEYRKRERQRKEEIERLQKIGTPDALRQIAILQKDQIRDAGEHGATASPDFRRIEAQAEQNLAETTALVSLPPMADKPKSNGPTDELAAIRDALASAGVAAPLEQSNGAPALPTPPTPSAPTRDRGLS